MYKLILCQRYLRTRYIALASIVSVTLGVATMIVVNSVMAGFSSEMRNRIQGILSDIIIETRNFDGEYDAERQIAIVRRLIGKYLAGVTCTVEVYGVLSFEYGGQWIHHPVTLIGIDPESKSQVGPLVDYLESYSAIVNGDDLTPAERDRGQKPAWELTPRGQEHRERMVKLIQERDQFLKELNRKKREAEVTENRLPNERMAAPNADVWGGDDPHAAPAPQAITGDLQNARVYIGTGLISYPHRDESTGKVRTIYMVNPGDDVQVSTVMAGTPPSPVYFPATLVDVFKSGMSEYDSNLVFCNLEALQTVRKMIRIDDGKESRAITSIQIKLKDFRDSAKVVDILRTEFSSERFTVRTWEQKQGPLLAAVDVEASILNILLFLIITVAGFGILAIFFMIVVEKTRDIGILKALGASSRGVMSIFLSYGLSLGMVGSGVGVVAGLLFVRYINQIEAVITYITGRKVFDEKIYYFKEIPTHVEMFTIVWIALGAIAIAVLASVLPARRAAQLQPVRALRYE